VPNVQHVINMFFDSMFGVQSVNSTPHWLLLTTKFNRLRFNLSWFLVITVMVKSQIMFSAKSLYLQPGGIFAVTRV